MFNASSHFQESCSFTDQTHYFCEMKAGYEMNWIKKHLLSMQSQKMLVLRTFKMFYPKALWGLVELCICLCLRLVSLQAVLCWNFSDSFVVVPSVSSGIFKRSFSSIAVSCDSETSVYLAVSSLLVCVLFRAANASSSGWIRAGCPSRRRRRRDSARCLWWAVTIQKRFGSILKLLWVDLTVLFWLSFRIWEAAICGKMSTSLCTS